MKKINIIESIKKGIRNWLVIDSSQSVSVKITETMDFSANAFKNRIWQRGDNIELEELYRQLPYSRFTFWGATQTRGVEIRKIHTGLPSIMIDSVSRVVLSDIGDIGVDQKYKDLWQDIESDNDFKALLDRAVKDVLIVGDGAFKVSYDKEISKLPIIEFIPGDKVEYSYTRGRIKEVVFLNSYQKGNKKFILKEHYGYGYIVYKLYREDNGNEVELSLIDETKEYKDVFFNRGIRLCMPLKFYSSTKYKDRGKSIFDSKADCFDALDEVFSQWMNAVRQSRPIKYIPQDMIPRDENTGALRKPNPFDDSFIATSSVMAEGKQNTIDLIQPTIPTDNYYSSYITALELCLEGVLSPSTIGVDVKKLDNAEAQREKEKTTLYTRNEIVAILEKAIPKLIEIVLQSYEMALSILPSKHDVSIDFGEYANPSFESRIEAVSKGRAHSIISIEACVDELYGDSKDEKWKKEEIQRLKDEQGMLGMIEPMLNDSLGSFSANIEE